MTKNNRIYLSIFLITLIGLLIRLSSIDKAGGLWNDEYISWYISSYPILDGFAEQVYKNCHMPFYYLYLKFWTFLFGNSDLGLRISSVIPCVLSIPIMFLIGWYLKNEKTGLYSAALTALSGFLIYFSQEVRFYSLLFFFSSIFILYTIKLTEFQSKKNYIILFIASILIMLTHTIGFVFVFFNCAVLFSYLKSKNQISVKTILTFVSCVIVLMSGFIPFLYKTLTASYVSQFWSDFSLTKLFFVFADYISPIQINIINTPINIMIFLFKNGHPNYGYFIFAIIPLIFTFFAILTSLKQNNEKIRLIFISAVATLAVMVIAAISGKLVLITKYTMEIYPVFLILVAFGISSFRTDTIKKIYIFVLFLLPSFYLLCSNYAPQKLQRNEGHKYVADLIIGEHLSKNDKILLLYYDTNRFGKYIPLNDYDIQFISKYNFQYMLLHNPPMHQEVIKNGKNTFLQVFTAGKDDFFSYVLKTHFFSSMKKGDKFALVTLNSVTFITPDRMQLLITDKSLYQRMPFLFLIFSHMSNIAQQDANKLFKPVCQKTLGNWDIYVWEKV